MAVSVRKRSVGLVTFVAVISIGEQVPTLVEILNVGVGASLSLIAFLGTLNITLT